MSLLDIERNNIILCHCLQPGKGDSNSDTAIGFAYFQTPLIIEMGHNAFKQDLKAITVELFPRQIFDGWFFLLSVCTVRAR